MIQEILRQFENIITETEFISIKEIRRIAHYKCKVQFIDGSNLRISEKRNEEKLFQYSYYWLDSENELIIGWDNAPHHPKISSYPHHKHIQQQSEVFASNENCLKDVLDFIKTRILD